MAGNETREIDRFTARSEEGSYETTGMKQARTIGGYACNRIDDDTWLVVALGLTVHRLRLS